MINTFNHLPEEIAQTLSIKEYILPEMDKLQSSCTRLTNSNPNELKDFYSLIDHYAIKLQQLATDIKKCM